MKEEMMTEEMMIEVADELSDDYSLETFTEFANMLDKIEIACKYVQMYSSTSRAKELDVAIASLDKAKHSLLKCDYAE